MTNPLLPRPARTAGRLLVWAMLLALLLAAAATVWVGVRGVLAYSHLQAAESAARELAADIGDPADAAERLASVAADTAEARALTSDPIWSTAGALPWVGPQLGAVAIVTAAVDDVAGDALEPLVRIAADFSDEALRPAEGRFDLVELDRMHTAAATSAAQVRRAATALDDLDRAPLLAPLAVAAADVAELLQTVQVGSDALERTTALMPAMLGRDGPRDYLVIFQNNAEWRSLGGIVGAMAVVHTDGGAISLAAQASSSDFPRYDDPVIDLGPDLPTVTEAKPAQWIQNATQAPAFPVAARIAQEMWSRETGTTVDGVLSIDPVALSYLLAATGPIELPTGDVLTGENALSLLLNEVYLRYENPAEQDAFFEAAAASVFAALAGGGADPVALANALVWAGDEHRLLLWNADESEQAVLDDTTLQGELPVTDADQTAFGVFVNDGTGSKMNYYTTLETGVAWCSDTEGTPDAALAVRLRNDAPADAAGLPAYITGGGGFGVPPGVAQTVSYLFLPEGAEVVASSSTGASSTPGFGTGTFQGRPALIWSSDLAPGEEATAHVRVRTPLTEALVAQVTPVLPERSGEVADPCTPAG